MAVTVGGRSPIIMDAAADSLESVFQGRDMQDPTAVPKLYVETIEFVAGAAGKCVLKQKAGGQVVFESPTLNAGENYALRVDRWMDGAYVDSIPAASKVMLHYA